MFRFSLEIIFSAFLFLSTWSFIESQSPSAFCSGPISELKFNTFAPKKIYSRASRLNMSFTGDNSVVATFDMFVSNDNVRRLTCAQQTFIKANNSYFQISCLINSSQVFETYGVKMKVNLNFLCNLQPTPQSVDYNYQLPQVELILIDPLVKLVEPETILRGHNCSYKIRYSGVDLEVGIPTPVELELKNGTRCTKKTDYSDFSVRMADVFTCFIGAGEYNLGYKLNASLLLNNHTWRTIPITVDTVPTIAQSHGSTFAGTIIGISFTGANLRSFRGAYLTTEHFSEPNYCTIVSETLMKCDCALGLPPVQSARQVKVYFWSHGNQLANSGSQITLQQNPAPIRETIKSFIKGYVMTILIENYKSDYIPWTKIKVYDTYENNVVECGNIKMNGNNNVTCLLDEEVSPSPDHQKLQITIGTWNANKNFNPVIEKIDLFFFQLAISFVLGLLLIYTVLYFLIRYKFKRPFNVRQVALAISHLVMAARSKLSLSTHKSMVSSKKSFTSLGRSKISLESKSKSKLDKITSKSLPKLTPVKKLKSILRRKSDLKYNSMLPDVTSLLTKSNRSLVLESKSSDGEIAVLKGKSKVLTKHPLRHKPKIPMTKGVKKLFSKAKSKPSLKQFKRRKP